MRFKRDLELSKLVIPRELATEGSPYRKRSSNPRSLGRKLPRDDTSLLPHRSPECSRRPLRRKIGNCELGWRARMRKHLRRDRFGGEVAAADGAFHRGRPAAAGVVAGEVEVGDASGRGRRLRGAEAIDAGERRERRALLNHDTAAL